MSDQRDRQRIKNMVDLIDHLREENRQLRDENEKFRQQLIAFTGVDPR
jgi:regulator of replication initiation timing